MARETKKPSFHDEGFHLILARRQGRTPDHPRFVARSLAFSSAAPAETNTAGRTPVPSQFVFEMGLIALANGTPIMLTDSREAALANAWRQELEAVSVH